MRREVFHLALDYIDRYYIANSNLTNDNLEVMAVAALAIAVKIEVNSDHDRNEINCCNFIRYRGDYERMLFITSSMTYLKHTVYKTKRAMVVNILDFALIGLY